MNSYIFVRFFYSEGISDRFYNALYRKLLEPEFLSSCRQPLLFHLLFKAIKSDVMLRRAKAFLIRLLQLALTVDNPSFVCSTLVLVDELLKVLNIFVFLRAFTD